MRRERLGPVRARRIPSRRSAFFRLSVSRFALGLGGALLLAAPSTALGWGFAAHRRVNENAAALVPGRLGAWLKANRDYLREHSVDPDLWRAAGDRSEEPQHFLDMDAFGNNPRGIARDEAAHLRQHGEKARDKGRVPWRAEEEYRALVAAFKARDGANILRHAAVLGHYVGDAHVPLHSVLNYDGQLSDQPGAHGRWESEMFERLERQALGPMRPVFRLLAPAKARARDEVFAALYESFAAVPGVLRADRACVMRPDVAGTVEDERYDDLFYSCFYEAQGRVLSRRLQRSIERLASLWHSAWAEAGRPSLRPYRPDAVRGTVRGVLISLDGSAHAVIDDAVARGVMPTLTRLRTEGTFGELRPVFPSKTAVAHASLFTGAPPEVHGIYGNSRPRPDAWLETENGYSSTGLAAEPLWAAAARQGLDATVAGATQVYPFEPYLGGRRFGGNYGRSLTLLDGYQGVSANSEVIRNVETRPPSNWKGQLPGGAPREFRLMIPGLLTEVDGLMYDDPDDPAGGLDTVALAFSKDLEAASTVRLKPKRADPKKPAFTSLPLRAGERDLSLFFRLFELAPDGSSLVLYRTAPATLRASRSSLERPLFEATGGFVGNGPSWAYGRGELGTTVDEGGDLEAERRYAEAALHVIEQNARIATFARDRTEWDLFFAYLPYPDETLHAWLGILDPTLPGHDAAAAARLRPLLDTVLAACDGFLEAIVSGLDRKSTVVVVATDHGLAGVNRRLRPNVALRNAGLLTLHPEAAQGPTPAATPDEARTLAYYGAGNSGHVFLREKNADLEARVRQALRSALPEDSFSFVERDAETTPPSVRISPKPGFDFSSDTGGAIVSDLRPEGAHGGDADTVPGLRGTVTFWGRGVAPSRVVDFVRQIDVAPTLAALLGLDPPRHATGGNALSPDTAGAKP
jgi:hypothetical protein